MKTAVAYLRTSSATNVGQDKDSHQRQLSAIESFATQRKLKLVEPPFYDAAVSGADPIDSRPGFADLLVYLDEHPETKIILVETASRFARDLIIQETGFRMLKERNIELIAVDSPDGFLNDSPTAELIRQILGAVSQFEKSMTVSKLRAARERKRTELGKCEGRKSYAEKNPQLVSLAKKLHRKPRNGSRRTLREIARELEARGFVTSKGTQFGPSQIKAMITQGS